MVPDQFDLLRQLFGEDQGPQMVSQPRPMVASAIRGGNAPSPDSPWPLPAEPSPSLPGGMGQGMQHFTPLMNQRPASFDDSQHTPLENLGPDRALDPEYGIQDRMDFGSPREKAAPPPAGFGIGPSLVSGGLGREPMKGDPEADQIRRDLGLPVAADAETPADTSQETGEEPGEAPTPAPGGGMPKTEPPPPIVAGPKTLVGIPGQTLTPDMFGDKTIQERAAALVLGLDMTKLPPAQRSLLTELLVTDTTRKNMIYADMMNFANQILDDVDAEGADWFAENFTGSNPRTVKIPFGVDNYFIGTKRQAYEMAKTMWVMAALRPQTGATINYTNEEPPLRDAYFPQPGQSDETMQLKRAARLDLWPGVVQQAGPTYVPHTIAEMTGLPDAYKGETSIEEQMGRTPSSIPTVQTPEEAMKLPSGTRFKDPGGTIRIRP